MKYVKHVFDKKAILKNVATENGDAIYMANAFFAKPYMVMPYMAIYGNAVYGNALYGKHIIIWIYHMHGLAICVYI